MSMLGQGESAGQPLHQVERTWSPWSRAPQGVRNLLRRAWRTFGLNHGTASLVRYEADMLALRARCALSPTHRRTLKRLTGATGLRVHLGCGNALFPGWVNIDCYPPQPQPGVEILTLDVRRGLPLADASVAALFSEHFLEHLPLDVVSGVILPEIRRILRPGGWVRLAVPDGEYFVDRYLAHRRGESDPIYERNRRGKTPMTLLNEIAHGYGHHFAYDFETLRDLLQAAGLRDIRRARAGDTPVEAFRGRDRLDEWRIAMSLYVEARAPGCHQTVATRP